MTITTPEIALPAEIVQLMEQAEEASYTILHCKYTTSPVYQGGWWINIWKTSYLVCGDERLEMLHAINVPYAPDRHYLKNFGDSLRFVLIFPQVPRHWQRFNFVEVCSDAIGLKYEGITRNDTGIYRVKL